MSTRHPASLPAKALYTLMRVVTPRLVRRIVLKGGVTADRARLARMGRVVNTVAWPQRLFPRLGTSLVRDHASGVPVETVVRRGSGAISAGSILYFHGGGFVTGGLNTHLHVVKTLARRTRVPVAHVDYRQFPDVDVAGSVRDAVRAYEWLLSRGGERVILAGDSAGGFLAFAAALLVQQRGMPAPAGVVGISPLLELDDAARSRHENRRRDAFGIPLVLPELLDQVCPSATMRHDLSPINGPLALMPPSLIVAAESEILRCDAERLAEALRRHNRPCRVELWENEPHGFPALLPFLPDSRRAYAMMADFVAECIAGAASDGEAARDVS